MIIKLYANAHDVALFLQGSQTLNAHTDEYADVNDVEMIIDTDRYSVEEVMDAGNFLIKERVRVL